MTTIISAVAQKPALAVAGGAIALVAASVIAVLKQRERSSGILPMKDA